MLGESYLEVERGKLLPHSREKCSGNQPLRRQAFLWQKQAFVPESIPIHLIFFPSYRNGPEFEARIRQNEINNPKFNFLNPNDPYHAYYRHKVSEFKEGKAQEPSAAIPKVMQQQQTAQQQLPQKVSVSFHFGQELCSDHLFLTPRC